MGDESGGLSNIPEELVTEILSYLPVKSLIRFTCVCKSWLSIIRNDHQFAMKHYLTRTTSSSEVLDNVDYMFDNVEKSRMPCLYSFTRSKTFRFLKKFECVPDMPIRVSNSCHGIICFDYLSRSRLGSDIILCNPSIKEAVLLPPCPRKGCTALGFDPINNDYKVVAVEKFCKNFSTVSVYSVRHGYWRNLHVFSASLLYIHKLKGHAALNANGRMCNWLFYKNLEYVVALLSFDMVEEVLKELPMPECLHPQRHKHQLLSSSRWQACLSCLPEDRDFTGGFIDVWVLKGSSKIDCSEDWTWSKVFAVKCPGLKPIQPLNFWLNDKELLVNVNDEGNMQEVFHYDLGTQQLTRTGRKGSLGSPARGYVESLVSIKNFMLPKHESKHCEDDKPNDDQDEASKQDDNGEFIFREVSRKGVRWFHSFMS